jgi:hypothetical protein
MPDCEDGFKALIVSLLGGLVLSFVVSSVFNATWAFLFNLFSILLGLVQIERSKFWGLSYALGYFGGLLLFGGYFMENWEYLIYILVIGAYIVQKIIRYIR